MPFGMEKLEWCGCLMVKTFEDFYSFWQNTRMWRVDRWTDSTWWHWPHLCTASCGKNNYLISSSAFVKIFLKMFVF